MAMSLMGRGQRLALPFRHKDFKLSPKVFYWHQQAGHLNYYLNFLPAFIGSLWKPWSIWLSIIQNYCFQYHLKSLKKISSIHPAAHKCVKSFKINSSLDSEWLKIISQISSSVAISVISVIVKQNRLATFRSNISAMVSHVYKSPIKILYLIYHPH